MAQAEAHTPLNWETVRRLIPTLKAHKIWLGFVWLTALVAGVMEFINPYLLKTLTDTALAQDAIRFRQLVLWALIAMTVDIALKYFKRIIAIRYETYTLRDLSNRLTTHIQHLPISYT